MKCMDKSYKPCMKNDIYINNTYVGKKGGYCVIGSSENDSQIIVKANKVEAFKELFSVLDGNNSIQDIEKMKFASSNELIRIVSWLDEKGMLEGSTFKGEFNEAERLSICLIRYKFHDFSLKTQKLCCSLVLIFKIVFLVTIIFTILCIIKNKYVISKLTIVDIISYKVPSIKNAVIGYILINLGSYLMGVLHECAHSVVAIKNKIKPYYIAFVLYLGFIPMGYVKIKNIYSLNKKNIYSVLFAGVLMNLLLCFIFMDLYFVFNSNVCKILSVANFKMFYINLIPLSLTDGYFIGGLLFNMPNIRMKFFKCLAYPKLLINESKRYIMIYFINLVTILVSLNFELYVIISIFKLNKVSISPILIIINIIYIYILHLINKYKFKKHEIMH